MGWTQHTVGVQNIRAMSIIQLLLGNMGMAGGGVNALRGESNVQGSTDHGLLFHILPGYLRHAGHELADAGRLQLKNAAAKSADPLSANWWQNQPKYMASLLKAYVRRQGRQGQRVRLPAGCPSATPASPTPGSIIFDDMYNGEIKGFFAWGQNPACSGANSNKTREALAKLDWMVNVNLFDNETGSFWNGPGMNPDEDQDRGLHAALRLRLGREGGQHHQQRPLDAVALQGDQAARAEPSRTGTS